MFLSPLKAKTTTDAGKMPTAKMGFQLTDKKVLVVGLARTGVAVARFLKSRGANVTATDVLKRSQLGVYGDQAADLDICLELGGHKIESFTAADLIVVSPGVPESIGPIETARRMGVPVIGEIELAAHLIEEPIVAVTGTNGKTTTTRLLGEMLKASGRRVFVGGNIGNPLIGYVDSGSAAEVVVAEISSFQLDTILDFRPKVATLLNITEDHLDRYDGFDHYVRSKARLFQNQDKTDVAVLNGTDPATVGLEPFIASQKLYFNIDPARPLFRSDAWHGVMVTGAQLIFRMPGSDSVVLDLSKMKLEGRHNLENAAAAALTALAAGGTRSGIQFALDTFEGLPHRLEPIKTLDGVSYYNDSKATNVDAVKRSLESFRRPVILIMGGRDKGGRYAFIEGLVQERVKALVVFGEAREKILAALGAFTRSQRAGSLAEAVAMAHEQAEPGDVVLLSPGCSSFDMFKDYVERGEVFRSVVERLTEK